MQSFRLIFLVYLYCSLLLGSLDFHARLQAAEGTAYGGRIVVSKTRQIVLSEAVKDLRETLSKISGEEFRIEESQEGKQISGEAGVFLIHEERTEVPDGVRKSLSDVKSREGLVIWPNGERLWLVSRSDEGLSHAVYFLLEELGCRWFFPTEKWTFLPARRDVRISKPVVKIPAFRSRVFFGTGGFGGDLPLDPTRSLQGKWGAWERRNRFGGEFRVSGHSGEAFNLRHREELEAHPEWRAMLNGRREPWSLSTKLCAGNRDAVNLYVLDRIEEYREQKKGNPGSPWAWAVSVDPADGGGHCTAPESLAIGSVSDRVFHVANESARALRGVFPEGSVSLFAYGEHAAVPSIPLEPNVYVMVIPYAFQRTGLTPDELLDAWSRKVPRMGVYDYWSIPDWTHDLPDFDPYGFGPERMRGWHRRGIDGFLVESTNSSGAMGLGWLIGSRLAWDPEVNVDQIEEDFLQKSFGAGSEPIRRMFRRWSLGFCLTSHELGLSFRDLDEACRLSESDTGSHSRILDFGRYVEYLRRRFEYGQEELSATEVRGAVAERLMRTMWRMYDSGMIHAFRLAQLLIRDEANLKNPELGMKYDWMNASAPVWKEIRPFEDREVRQLIKNGLEQYSPRGFEARRYAGELVRLPTDGAKTVAPDREEFSPEFWLNDSFEGFLRADQVGERYLIRIGTDQPVRITLTNSRGKIVSDQSVVTGENYRDQWSDVAISTTEPGIYRLGIDSPKRMYRVSFPSRATLTMRWWTNSQGTPTPRIYFFVPSRIERAAIYTDYIDAGLPRYFDPEGHEVQPEVYDNGHLMVLDIPARHRGKIWSLDRAKMAVGPLRTLNIPNAFALHPLGLMVPKDALE